MIVFPNCKINLGLEILRKRPDGFHDLQTIFYPVNYTDVLEFIKAPSFQFQSSGLAISGDSTSNLCVRAYSIMRERFPELPAIHMHLHKNIPMGAGLGGGSSDGAFALKALADYFQLGLSTAALLDMALELGSDCPFFIINRPVVAMGRGELMESVDLSLSGYILVMVHPGIHVDTKQAFLGITPAESGIDLKQKIQEPIHTWRWWLTNQFENSVSKQFPIVGEIKDLLYQQGAVYASMSGSGSVVYGIFKTRPTLSLDPRWKTITVTLE